MSGGGLFVGSHEMERGRRNDPDRILLRSKGVGAAGTDGDAGRLHETGALAEGAETFGWYWGFGSLAARGPDSSHGHADQPSGALAQEGQRGAALLQESPPTRLLRIHVSLQFVGLHDQ